MTEYSIEGKKVLKLDYDAFIKTLVEQEDTYHCAKTIGGGRNSYEAKDTLGATWICRSVTTNDKTTMSVDRK